MKRISEKVPSTGQGRGNSEETATEEDLQGKRYCAV